MEIEGLVFPIVFGRDTSGRVATIATGGLMFGVLYKHARSR